MNEDEAAVAQQRVADAINRIVARAELHYRRVRPGAPVTARTLHEFGVDMGELAADLSRCSGHLVDVMRRMSTR